MKEQPKGTVIIMQPERPETTDEKFRRMFGVSIHEYAMQLLIKYNS